MRKALELDGQLAGAHTALGVVLANTGRRAEAIEAWKRAVQLDRGELDALFNLTVNLVQIGRLDEARTYGSRFIAGAPPRFTRTSLKSGGCLASNGSIHESNVASGFRGCEAIRWLPA